MTDKSRQTETSLHDIFFILIKYILEKLDDTSLFQSKTPIFFLTSIHCEIYHKLGKKLVKGNGGTNLKGKIINVDVFHSILNVELLGALVSRSGRKYQTTKVSMPLSKNII